MSKTLVESASEAPQHLVFQISSSILTNIPCIKLGAGRLLHFIHPAPKILDAGLTLTDLLQRGIPNVLLTVFALPLIRQYSGLSCSKIPGESAPMGKMQTYPHLTVSVNGCCQ